SHDRVVRFLDVAGPDVAFDDLWPVFCGRRYFQWHCCADYRDGGASEGVAPGRVPASGALPESREASLVDESALGVLHRRRTADKLVRQRIIGNGRVLGNTDRILRTAFLDDGVLQLCYSLSTSRH